MPLPQAPPPSAPPPSPQVGESETQPYQIIVTVDVQVYTVDDPPEMGGGGEVVPNVRATIFQYVGSVKVGSLLIDDRETTMQDITERLLIWRKAPHWRFS